MSHKDSLRLQRQSEAQGPSAKAKPCRVRLPTWQDSITRRGSTRSTIRGGLLERQTNHVARAPFQPQPADLESKAIASHPFNPLPCRSNREKPPLPEAKNPSEQMTTTPWDGEKTHVPGKRTPLPVVLDGSSTSFPKQKDLLRGEQSSSPHAFNPLARTRPSNPIPEQRKGSPPVTVFPVLKVHSHPKAPFRSRGPTREASELEPPFSALCPSKSH